MKLPSVCFVLQERGALLHKLGSEWMEVDGSGKLSGSVNIYWVVR